MKRIIQVGVGAWGRAWADMLADTGRWQVSAFVDTDSARLAAAAAHHSVPLDRCFTNLRRALSAVEADAVLDITPASQRSKVCSLAFKRGLHVLCEKPLADSVKAAEDLVARAEESNCVLMVAQTYRHRTVVRTMRRVVERGRLGEIAGGEIRFFRGPKFGGFREAMEHPLLLDMGIHHLDMARAILGCDIRAVQAWTGNPPWTWFKGDALAGAQIEMENGALLTYSASWVAPHWETSWNGNWRLDGSKGALLLEDDLLYVSQKPRSRRNVPLLKPGPSEQEAVLEAFARALDSGEEPETSGRRNLNSLAASHALVRAAREKRRVAIREMYS